MTSGPAQPSVVGSRGRALDNTGALLHSQGRNKKRTIMNLYEGDRITYPGINGIGVVIKIRRDQGSGQEVAQTIWEHRHIRRIGHNLGGALPNHCRAGHFLDVDDSGLALLSRELEYKVGAMVTHVRHVWSSEETIHMLGEITELLPERQAVVKWPNGKTSRLHIWELEPSPVEQPGKVAEIQLQDMGEIKIEASRINGKTTFRYEVPEVIEAVYKGLAKEEKESKSWGVGLKFYYIPDILADERYKRMLGHYNLFDDFGSAFTRKGLLNIAWLRTVGGKGEIEIKDNISYAELTELCRNATSFCREYFEEYIRDFRIEGSLQIKI